MSKIYEALKKAEREKESLAADEKGRQPSVPSAEARIAPEESTLPSVAADEYRKMENIIKSANANAETRAVLLLSAVHGEGTSSVSAQFARSLAQSGQKKILLVDANLRSPVLHDLFGMERTVGFAELLEGKVSASEAVKKTEHQGLHMITSGERVEDPPHLLSSPRFQEALTEWKRDYSYIIFDSPPALAYADAAILGRQLDGVVLVVHAGKTRWEVIQKAHDTLSNAKASILGVVLNKRQYVIPRRVYRRL